MNDIISFLPYLLVMAGVTYLIRMIPLVFIRKKITNPFVLSFLYYIPYAVLSAMTFPAILFCTGNIWSAAAGLAAGIITAFMKKSLITVALSACAAAMIIQLMLNFAL